MSEPTIGLLFLVFYFKMYENKTSFLLLLLLLLFDIIFFVATFINSENLKSIAPRNKRAFRSTLSQFFNPVAAINTFEIT